tara:strand:- start:42 stop:269 length:228 start_codon:yes stop_codon:yes gene_type:complete
MIISKILTKRTLENKKAIMQIPNKKDPDKKIIIPLFNGKFAIINVPRVAPTPSRAAKTPKIIGKSERFVCTKTVN